MRRIEHAPAGDAGSVTMGAVRVGSRMVLEVVVHAAVLRAIPWYRGGMGVTILVNPYGGGVLDIERAGPDGPYRLRARVANRLDKLPPVQLRVPALPDMDGEAREAEPVAYETYHALLVTWATGDGHLQLRTTGTHPVLLAAGAILLLEAAERAEWQSAPKVAAIREALATLHRLDVSEPAQGTVQ